MKYDIVSKKIKKTELLLKKYIEDRFDNILLNVNEQYLKKIKVNDDDALKNEQKNFEYVKKELKNYCNTSLKKYLSNSKPKILNLYVEFLEYLKGFLLEEQIKIQKNIINIKNKEVEFEDLGIIMYLTYKIYGPKEFDKYRHTVIDEAQDLGDFNFYALSKILPNSTFSIFGDLAQSIYQYRGIENWDVITNKIFNNKCNLKYLLKSYRTTTEIMNSANNLVKYLGLSVAEPVIRHGVKVGYKKIENKCKDIEEIIKNYLIKDYSSIAIICKDKQEVFEIYEVIENKFLNIDVIVDTNTIYNGGICIITSYLAKGLEFDGVIITDASKEKYSEKNSIDMKLLYVSMTRALHELNVLYNNINKALEREIII